MIDEREMASTFGYGVGEWEGAKAEARKILYEYAKKPSTVSYSELTSKIHKIKFHPHDPALRKFLGQISREEAASGRAMLTAIVVHKNGDKVPGDGFWTLAAALGRDTSDKDKCWSDELNRLFAEVGAR